MTISFWDLLKDYEVEIPIMQRDYAQGRKTGKVPAIRQRFLQALGTALKNRNEKALELDFVYGYVQHIVDNETNRFIPLDGQQRLTSLFLIHWFFAAIERKLDEAIPHLLKFSYETRHSSREFCKRLVEFREFEFSSRIGDIIENQPWFFTAWKNDPTVQSMLVMLNDIQQMASDLQLQDVWLLLTEEKPPIVFHLLSMQELGLPDELYIKMNSRGKELTDFEFFKSRFSEYLKGERLNEFNLKIDQEWSDLFWDLFKDDISKDVAQSVDSGFLRFFRYLTDVLIYRNEIEQESNADDFINFKKVYSNGQNVDFVFRCLDVLSVSLKNNPAFFESVFYVNSEDFSTSKTRLFFQKPIVHLFRKCAENYDTSHQNNPFSIGEQLLLYACILHLENNSADFSYRVRKLRNLVANSEDTVRKENMPSLLNTVERIILDGEIGHSHHFNPRQAKEEKKKDAFLQDHVTLETVIFRLEDHRLLQGCLAIFKLEQGIDQFAGPFHRLFHRGCDYDAISCALLSFDDYSQKYSWRRRFGNKNDSVWRELFTPSQRRGDFQKTQHVLYNTLEQFIQHPACRVQDIIEKYLAKFTQEDQYPKDWRYYFIKYADFRKNDDGFYHWPESGNQYDCIMMRRSMFNGFHWSPFLYTLKQLFPNDLDLDNYGDGHPRVGAPLVITNGTSSIELYHVSTGFQIQPSEEGSTDFFNQVCHLCNFSKGGVFTILQNQSGVDVEDRVKKGIEMISQILNNVKN